MKKLNRSHLGQIAQLKVELESARKNILVNIPTIPSRYDALLDLGNNKLSRVQIKFCNNKCSLNTLQLNLERKHLNQKSYNQKDVDLLLVYVLCLDKILAFPPKMFHNKPTIYINLKNEESKNFWKKFEW